MATTESRAAVTAPVSLVAMVNRPSGVVVTVPTTVCPSFRAMCNCVVDVIAVTAPQEIVTSPANSVFITRLLASDLTMVPERRSPFFIVT
jgi:hypothetical protein